MKTKEGQISFGRTVLIGIIDIVPRSFLHKVTQDNLTMLERHGYKFEDKARQMKNEDMCYTNSFIDGRTPEGKKVKYVIRYTTSGMSGQTLLYVEGSRQRQQVNMLPYMKKRARAKYKKAREKGLYITIRRYFREGHTILPNITDDGITWKDDTCFISNQATIDKIINKLVEEKCPHKVKPLKDCIKCLTLVQIPRRHLGERT